MLPINVYSAQLRERTRLISSMLGRVAESMTLSTYSSSAK